MYKRQGQVRVTGHVQGRTVEALVDVIGVEQVLPVIKPVSYTHLVSPVSFHSWLLNS